MKIFKKISTFALFFLSCSAFAQVQIDKQIQMTGSGTDAKINGIRSATDSLDATSVQAVQSGGFNYAAATGSSNSFNLNISPPINGYQPGMIFSFLSNQTTTGPTTLQVNSLVAITIKKYVNQNLTCGDIQSGQAVTILYDGTNFQATSVLAAVTIPTITSTTPGAHSGPGTVTLGAIASGGTINWYAAATGGSSLGTGTSFTTPVISATTTYFAAAIANGCASTPRTAVIADIKAFEVDNAGTLTTGLISYYKLEDTTDFWGIHNLNKHNALVFDGGKILNGADGGSTNGSGTTNYLNAGSNLGINGGTVSISIWVNVNTNPSSIQSFVSQTNASSSLTSYQIDYTGTQLIWDRARLGIADQELTYGVTLTTGTWHHLVLTYDGTNIEGWLDGVSRGTFAASGNGTNVLIDDFSLLDFPTLPSGWAISAKIDEVGVWSKKLSNQEISDLYNGGAGQTMQ